MSDLVSLGASWVFSFQSVLPPVNRPSSISRWGLGHAINAVTGTRLWVFAFFLSRNVLDFMPPPASLCGCYCATVRTLLRSPTADAAKPPAFAPSQSRLAFSHSFHHCTSNVRRYGSPSLLMCICGSLCPEFL